MNDLIKIDERIDNVIKAITEMEDAFNAIQQPRTSYVLERFVVGQHDTDTQRYAQCVLEMQIKY